MKYIIFFFFRSVVKRTIRPLDFRVSNEQRNISMWIGQQSQKQFYYKVRYFILAKILSGWNKIRLDFLTFVCFISYLIPGLHSKFSSRIGKNKCSFYAMPYGGYRVSNLWGISLNARTCQKYAAWISTGNNAFKR